VVAFGSSVEIVDEASGRTQTWTIVGSTEADATAGRLSAESPVARALIGHGPGDTVEVATPRGARRLRIESVGG
jgi:transcription elongation factor GreA